MKPGHQKHERLEDLKRGPHDLDQAEGGGLKANEAEMVRGGKSKKSSGGDTTTQTPK